MNKTLISAFLAVLLLGGGAYYFTRVRTEVAPNPAADSAEINDSMTLKGLLGLGKNLQCSFSAQGVEDGKVYVSGNKVRGDFTLETENSGNMSASMISDGDWIYYWSSAMPQGVKVQSNATVSTDVQNSIVDSFDPNTEVDYSCSIWRVDPDKFMLPEGVEFVDLSAQIDMMMQNNGSGASCASCDYLTGEARSMCLKSLGC